MIYPTISEYVEAIRYAEDNFATLTNLRPVLDDDGNPIMSSGNFAVVFKMQDIMKKKYYALKCFIKDQQGRDTSYIQISDELEYVSSDYIVSIMYMDKELFVDSNSSTNTEFPVLLMDWVEGVTLDKWIKQHLHSQHSLNLITYQFCRMASWLMSQPFAHGDLKPDNILVRVDGSLVLVDYDGMFVPSMQGQKARELGSPDFCHPSRTIDDFNEHIDDFSLAAIAMQICVITLEPSIYRLKSNDSLILTQYDFQNLATKGIPSFLFTFLSNMTYQKLFSLFLIAYCEKSLSSVSFRLFNIQKDFDTNYGNVKYSAEDIKILSPKVVNPKSKATRPKSKRAIKVKHPGPIHRTKFNTKISIKDYTGAIIDSKGVKYSKDGKKLIHANTMYSFYTIKNGTLVICDKAFFYCETLNIIKIPNSVMYIGDDAFSRCKELTTIYLPKDIQMIGKRVFGWCSSLRAIIVPKGMVEKYARLLPKYKHLITTYTRNS